MAWGAPVKYPEGIGGGVDLHHRQTCHHLAILQDLHLGEGQPPADCLPLRRGVRQARRPRRQDCP